MNTQQTGALKTGISQRGTLQTAVLHASTSQTATQQTGALRFAKCVVAAVLLVAVLTFGAAIQPASIACAKDLGYSGNMQVAALEDAAEVNAAAASAGAGDAEAENATSDESAKGDAVTGSEGSSDADTGDAATGGESAAGTSMGAGDFETTDAATGEGAAGSSEKGSTTGSEDAGDSSATTSADNTAAPAATPSDSVTPANNAETPAATPSDSVTSTPNTAATPAASESQAPPLEDGAIYVISSAINQNFVLDVAGGSHESGANVQVCENNGTLAQAFKAVWISDNLYYFINMGSGLALDITGGSRLSRANVQQYAQNQSSAQMWKVVKNADGSFTIYAGTNPKHLALDVSGGSTYNGANVWLFVKNGCAAQQWFFTKQSVLTDAASNSVNITEGIYTIVSDLSSGRVVEVAGGQTGNGANVQIYDSNSTFAQKVKIISVGAAGADGANVYIIQFTNSDKVLDVACASTQAGANVQQYESNSTRGQYWYFKNAVQSGFFNIYSLLSGLVLDIAGGTDANGANVQVYTLNNSEAQAFRLDATQLINNGTYVIQSTVMPPMVLDVADASCDSGANIQTWRSNGSGAQKFAITHLGGEIYQILNINSWHSLDVCGGSFNAGANVQQYAWNNTDAQKWRIFYSDGTFTIQNVGSGMFLDLTGASRFAGANVQQYGWNGSAAQRWILRDENWTFYAGASWDAMRFIEKAEEYQGWSYVWGGRSPNVGFDCAGLVMYCANETLGKSYNLMYTNAESLFYNHCYEIAEWEAQPGDLVFYRGTYGSDVNYISHVVIYCGNGIYYGAGDPIGYDWVYGIRNIYGETASVIYARMW